MGKGGKPKVEVTEYYMSEHFGVCIGPLDALLDVVIKEKSAWSGVQNSQGSFEINLPELFGGVKKEGGAKGIVTYLPGASDQLMPDGLAQKLGRTDGNDCPAFRGIASLFFTGTSRLSSLLGGIFTKLTGSQRGFYWTANTPYLPGVWAKVLRAPIGLNPDYALIPNGSGPVVGTVEITWFQNTFIQPGGNDEARMGIGFLDSDGALIGSVTWSSFAQPTVWTERSVSAVAPSGARTVRIYAGFHRNAGTVCDGYIDGASITLNGLPMPFINPGAELGDTTGWTNEVGSMAVAASGQGGGYPDGYDGDFYFYGGNNAETTAYQDFAGGRDNANPAHIIYECLTNVDWGMGSPASAIDYDAFDLASQTLYAEQFGLSLLWTRQSTIQDFIQEILDHIQAVIYVDPSTGLLTLSLIRSDYVEDDLPVIDPDNADLTSFSRKLWGDIVNEIVVTWTNPENEQEETITVQDDASIAIQGGIVSDSRNYYGVRNATLAQQLAWRDLRSAGQPLAAIEAEVDRSQWALRPASVVKVTWPEYGLSELVMRVQSIDYGKPGNPTIKLSLIEDVYGLDVGSYDDPPSTSWTDPTADPEEMGQVEIITLPYFFASNTTVAAFVESPEYPEVLAGILATTDNEDAFDYDLWDEVTLANGSTEWQSITTNNIIGHAELVADLDAEATTANVSFDNLIGRTSPTVAGFVIIGNDGEEGNEIAMIDSDAGGDYDLIRGVLDTVPRSWPAGTPVWFVDSTTVYEDSLVRSSGETVDYKLLMRTSQGVLDLASASLESATLTDRPWMPNRPADVTAYGEAWSSQTSIIDARLRPDPWITVEWANRNRLDEDSQILSWTDATQTPEDGQTTTIEVRSFDGTLITTHDGLTGTSFDVPNDSFGGEPIVRLRVMAERSDADGDFVSLQYFEHWLQVFDGALVLDDGSLLLTEDGDTVILEG
jgi:hypothetical protein